MVGVHGRRNTMSNYIYKLLMIDGVLPHANDELRDIVMASGGDGYEALYSILRCVHPKLTDTKVDMKIPCQGVSDTFVHQIKNIRSTIKNEAIRGCVYNHYEGLELVLGTLHPKYDVTLSHKTEMAFKEESTEVPATPLEASALEKAVGFSYRTVIGGLMFAYVTCRLDIGFAMAELLKFNAAPASCHYAAARWVCCYLRESKIDGIIFWRHKSDPALPHIPLTKRPIDDIDLLVRYPADMEQLVGYMDAVHGTCLRTRQSVGGGSYVLLEQLSSIDPSGLS
jgi:hypothetical protein